MSFLGVPELTEDERFADNAARKENEAELNIVLESVLKEQDGILLAQKLLKDGVPAGAVLEVSEVFILKNINRTKEGILKPEKTYKFQKKHYHCIDPVGTY